MQGPPTYTSEDFAHSPFVLFYEVTRACDLVCKHCRACARPIPHRSQLSPKQSKELIRQIASFPKRPVLIFTGGDPMKRDDIFDLVAFAGEQGLSTAMTPSATPLVTREAVRRLKDSGLSRLALSLDAADAPTHDTFRGVAGSFDRTLEILGYARDAGLPSQINTTITLRNVDQVDEMADLFAKLGIVLWSVFFLIPIGRGRAEQRIKPRQYEEVFDKLFRHSLNQPYGIKTTEAPHYRRFVLERAGNPQFQPGGSMPGRIQRAPIGVNDGKGAIFVSHTGAVYPSGFMPIQVGKFPDKSIVDVYRDSPILQMLRDPDALQGKCRSCEYRGVCGGSRARSYAVTRDPMAAEPDCVYDPKALRERSPCLA